MSINFPLLFFVSILFIGMIIFGIFLAVSVFTRRK
jgi:hypothetical protein